MKKLLLFALTVFFVSLSLSQQTESDSVQQPEPVVANPMKISLSAT